MSAPLLPEDFQQITGVSRETLDRLRAYAELLVKWQPRINLVGPATIPDLWRRHFLDSAQIFPLLPQGPLVDFGSGAGFPGLVVAVMGAGPVHLMESDARKCAFLREAARITGTAVTIHNQRIEKIPAFPAAAMTARALAPLVDLLQLGEKFITPQTVCVFLKGRGAEDELTAASKEWNMSIERRASLTDDSGLILRLKEVHRG